MATGRERSVLRVEGPDDMHVLRHLLSSHGIDHDKSAWFPSILTAGEGADVPGDGRTTLLRSIRAAVRLSEGRAVGFVLDADDSVENTWRAISDRLEKAGVEPRAHLQARDKWDMTGVDAQSVHLMVQTMESWIVADADALSRHYGPASTRGCCRERRIWRAWPRGRLSARCAGRRNAPARDRTRRSLTQAICCNGSMRRKSRRDAGTAGACSTNSGE